jgi:hypothetical protein
MMTWVMLALPSGVPLELVQKVTGHRTTDIVLKHYFQPGREGREDARDFGWNHGQNVAEWRQTTLGDRDDGLKLA